MTVALAMPDPERWVCESCPDGPEHDIRNDTCPLDTVRDCPFWPYPVGEEIPLP